MLGANGFTKDTDNEVVIKAESYKDITLKVNKDGSVNTGSTPVDPSEPDQPGDTIKLPITDPEVTREQLSSGNTYYSLKFDDESASWLNNITGLVFGEDEYEAVDSIDELGSKKYFVDKENGKIDIIPYSFASYPCEVRISANGCSDLVLEADKADYFSDPTFKIKNIGTTDPTEPSQPDQPGETTGNVPTEAPSIEKDGSVYTLTFTGSKDWIGGISDIKVDGVSGTKDTSKWNLNSTGKYAINKDSEAIYLYLQSPSWGGDDIVYTVVVSSNECSDVTLKITVPSGLLSAPTVTIVK